MTKRKIKIVILFIPLVIILYGGWHMYKRLEYNKQSFTTDVYSYISPDAVEIININKSYEAEELDKYYPESSQLLNILKHIVHPPVIISKYPNELYLLTTKAGIEQDEQIKQRIEKDIALPYPPLIKNYKDTEVFVYSLPNNKFLVCSFYKGLLIISHNYKLVENIIDADPEHSFFSDEDYKEIVDDALNKYPVGIFSKLQNDLLSMHYNCRGDTIVMEGYLLSKVKNDSIATKNKLIHYMESIPNGTCIDSYDIYNENKWTMVKIILNKIY